MAEANETAAERDPDFFPLNDLPNDLLVSVFAAAEDPTWVGHTFPLVCRAWNELYLSKNASPLHETLEVDFDEEAAAVAREGEEEDDDEEEERTPRPPAVHASRVISWAQGRAGSVHKLRLEGGFEGGLGDFTAEDLGRLAAAVGPSLTDISIGKYLGRLCQRPFWESLRTSGVSFGRLRSIVVHAIWYVVNESDLEPLGQLAGSLEELVLKTNFLGGRPVGLTRFPESFFALSKLRRLVLFGHPQITTIPAGISSMKKLEDLDLVYCDLSSPLPKELGELSGLTKLDLSYNWKLGNPLSAAEAFPAELGKMKSLRELDLGYCRLRTVPAFVGELKSLESLSLRKNDLSSLPKELGELSGLTKLDLSSFVCYRDIHTRVTTLPADVRFPAELGKMKSLRELDLSFCRLRAVPAFVGELKSLEVLNIACNDLSSLPKELGEFSGLKSLKFGCNRSLGNTPQHKAFPAELGKMKSLRELDLSDCGLRTVPAFVGELESLESLNLLGTDLSSPEDEAFPAELKKMKSLRELNLSWCRLRTVPSFAFEQKSLKRLVLFYNDLFSLPKELGELSGLTRLELWGNTELGSALPAAEAFPAELGKMSLRELYLGPGSVHTTGRGCGLRTVPSFVYKLKSLEILDLSHNEELRIDASLELLIEGCPRLRQVRLEQYRDFTTPESRALLRAFKAKLRSKNPRAKVLHW